MKDFFIFNSLNIFSLIILILLFLQAKNYYDNEATKNKRLWIASLICVFVAQVIDIICWALSGVPGNEVRIVFYLYLLNII
jgi:magnesium-transporting ATPase (P-type)